MTLISTSIIIDSTPEVVRKSFLDFKHYPEWAPFITSVQVQDKKRDQEIDSYADLKAGEHLVVALQDKEGAKPNIIEPVLLENSPERFQWKGKVLYDWIFWGAHKFEFKPIENGTKTELIHSEQFGGLLTSIVIYFFNPEALFIRFNESLKKRVESI
ncbi:uncharacterized protein KQ657_003124 [Scheffersomyces spartinae]|uniref:SRPBCC family protein n=1 Tax=Scheffersomyces spartinae TaxID=45513 RepID=A0A9P7V5S0_9ASCO|nr:uncharacterized protein KQ657_003124 [Scheffersomyces spartinae]KAG7191449.1 hypothetical protein KQ657_003124 [Scheffersomyces spartinae]